MKRLLLGLLLAAILVLGASSASLAAPPAGGTGVFLFGEYAPLFEFEPIDAFVGGVGFSITDNFTVGVQVQIFNNEFILGGFAEVGIGPVVISGEFCVLTPGPTPPPPPDIENAAVRASNEFGESVVGRIKAAYVFDLSPVQLSIGGGALFFLGGGPSAAPFIEGAASVGLGNSFSVYGKFDYYINSPFPWNVTYTAGVSLAL